MVISKWGNAMCIGTRWYMKCHCTLSTMPCVSLVPALNHGQNWKQPTKAQEELQYQQQE